MVKDLRWVMRIEVDVQLINFPNSSCMHGTAVSILSNSANATAKWQLQTLLSPDYQGQLLMRIQPAGQRCRMVLASLWDHLRLTVTITQTHSYTYSGGCAHSQRH